MCLWPQGRVKFHLLFLRLIKEWDTLTHPKAGKKPRKMGIFWPSSMDLCLPFLLKALAKAEDQFKRIMAEYPEESCFCLAHYGIGRVYLRQNRLVWWEMSGIVGKKKSFYSRNCDVIFLCWSLNSSLRWIWSDGFNVMDLISEFYMSGSLFLLKGADLREYLGFIPNKPQILGSWGELRGKEQTLFVLRGKKAS